MQLQIISVHEIQAVALGPDAAGKMVVLNVTAYVVNAGNADAAVPIVEAQVLKEAIIPDGKGGFNKPTLVQAQSVEPITELLLAPLVYLHTAGDTKFVINLIYEVQVLAAVPDSSVTISVYPLILGLRPALALAEADVKQMAIVPDPFGSGQLLTPDTTVATGGKPVSAAPLSAPILSN